MWFDHRIFCSEADTVSLSYTSCYVRMATHCHVSSHVVADPFTNMVMFFMSDSLKAINPFLDRIPRELHEIYTTDCLMEFMKLAETNKTTNEAVTSVKYTLIVAFARKPWKLQESIGCYVQIRLISESRLVTIHPTTHAYTAHYFMYIVLAWNKKDYMHTPNNELNHTWISISV